MRDQLGAPRPGPGAVLAVGLAQAGEARRWRTWHDRSVRQTDLAIQTLLDVGAKARVRDELRYLGSLGRHVGLPLRDRRPIATRSVAGGGVAAQLTRDRPRVTSDGASDLANALALDMQQRNLLTFRKRQIPARRLPRDVEWRHTASVAEPPLRDRGRHADNRSSLDRHQPLGDLDPKRSLDVALVLRMTRRPQLGPDRSICILLTTHHHTPPNQGVATTS